MNEAVKILVVDDNPDIRTGSARVLERAGYSVAQAASGEEALTLVPSVRPDLLLLNRDLSGIDGLEVCRRIKQDVEAEDCFVVLASGSYVKSEDQVEGLEAGADGYLTRPITNRELLARVGTYRRLIHLSRELRRKNQTLKESGAAAAAAQAETLNLMEDALAASQRLETLNHKLQNEIAERARVEDALWLNATALDTVSQGVLIAGLDHLIRSANSAFTNITGYSQAEVLGRNCKFLQGPASAPATIDAIRSALEREVEFSGEILNYCKDGTPFWNELTISPARDAHGAITHFVGVTRDVTERKQAQEKLLTTNRLLAKLSEQVPGVIYQYRLYPDGRSAFPHASVGINDIYEVTPEEVRDDATPVFSRLHPDDLARVSESIHHSARTLETFFCEFRVVLPRQGLRWRWCQAQPERTEDGGTLWHGIISDVTERKGAEEEIAHQSSLRAALLALPVLAETLLEKDLMQQGQELAEDLTGSVISFIHFVNPDGATIELTAWSRRTLEKYCHAAYDSHYPVSSAGIWADALRERRPVVFNDYASYPEKHGLPEGHSHLQRLISVPVIENGRVVMMAGVGNKPEDYTERDVKTVQLIADAIHRLVQRRRTEGKLRQFSRIVEQAPLAIAITDLTGALAYANPAFCAGSGYTLPEVLGQNPRVLKSGLTDPAVYRDMWQTITRGEVWRGELKNRKKSGEIYDELAVIAPVADESGAISHFVALKQDITERKAGEAALRESEQNFRELFDLESDAILVFEAETGLIVQANDAAISTYGYSLPELLRLHTTDITVEPDKSSDLLATARSTVDQVIKVPFRLHRRRDGTVFPVELSIRTFRRAAQSMLVAVVRDITEQIKAREQLERFNAELETTVAQRTEEITARNRQIEALLQSVPDLVLRARSDGTVLDVRSAKGATPLAAISAQAEHPGQLAALVHAALPLAHRALAENTTVALETELPLGSPPLATELRVAPVGEDEFVVFARDISERKRFEASMVSMLEKERQISEMKSRFIAVTSHEFRTPMAAAMASADLLHNHLDHLLPAKREELFARIASALRRMTEMLDELLLLNRIEANRVEVRLGPLHLPDFTRNVIEEIRLGDRDAHRFEFETSAGSIQVMSDGNLLHHVLANLLSNAVRYSASGTTVAIRLVATPGQVRVIVDDRGIGVPEADRERIFEPFERGSNVGVIKGSGLGLNIVKRMCGLLGASIVYEPAPAGGSRFILTLPLLPEPAPASP